jgi:hypothetical protein
LGKRRATPWLAAFFSLITITYFKKGARSQRPEVHFFCTFFRGASEKGLHFQINARCGHRMGFLSDHAGP